MPRTTTIIIGAGQAGLAMSRCLSELGIEHVVLERGQAGAALAQPQLGFAASADAELDDPPSGIPVRRPRPGRLHVRPGTDCVLRTLRRLVGGAGPHRHGRAKRRAIGEWLPRRHQPRRLVGFFRGGGDRILRSAGRSCREPRAGAIGPADGAAGLPASRTIAGRWRPRRRRVFHRRAARRRDSALRTAGHAGRRSSHAIASTPPRTRHPVVAGSTRRAEPGSRRRSRYRAFTPPAVPSAGWQTGSFVRSIWRCCTTEVFGWWAGSATSTAIA